MSDRAYSIENEEIRGEIQIADEVVCAIAAIAATEVDGVASIAGNVTSDKVAHLGMKKIVKGVKAEIIENIVTISLTLNMKYDYNIREVTAKVQEKVKSAIESMTGMEVNDVNIRVAGVEITDAE